MIETRFTASSTCRQCGGVVTGPLELARQMIAEHNAVHHPPVETVDELAQLKERVQQLEERVPAPPPVDPDDDLVEEVYDAKVRLVRREE